MHCIKYKPKCLKHEDHWVETTDYREPTRKWAHFTELKRARRKGQRIQEGMVKEGLSLRFSWEDDGGEQKTVDCKLSQLWAVEGESSLTYRLSQDQSCAAFRDDPDVERSVLLASNITGPQFRYESGRQVRQWDGAVRKKPIMKTVMPQTIFAGTLRIR